MTAFEEMLDGLVERVARRTSELVLECLGKEGTTPRRNEVEGLLGIRQAAGHLGISASTLYKMAAKGTIPRVRVGKRLLFRPEDVREFIESRHVNKEKVIHIVNKIRDINIGNI